MKLQVEIFQGNDPEVLQREINHWLRQRQNDDVRTVTQSETTCDADVHTLTISVWYTE